MLIRMHLNSIFVSFALLVGLTHCFAQDGYDYRKPTVRFGDGYQSLATASQAVYEVSNQKPSLAPFSSSSRESSEQFKTTTISSVSKPQTFFESSQLSRQSVLQPQSRPAFSQFGSSQSDQYQQSVDSSTLKQQETKVPPAVIDLPISNSLSQSAYESPQFGQSYTGASQSSQYQGEQYKGSTTSTAPKSQAVYKAPVIPTLKPQTFSGSSFGQSAFQSQARSALRQQTFSASPFRKTSFQTQTRGTSQFPQFSQSKTVSSTTQSGQYRTEQNRGSTSSKTVRAQAVSQYKAPATSTFTTPQSFSSSSFGKSVYQTRPVSSFSQYGQSAAKLGGLQSGQYQNGKYQGSAISVASKPVTVPQYKAPAFVASSKPQSFSSTAFGQSISQNSPASQFSQFGQSKIGSQSQSGQYRGGNYQGTAFSTSSKPKTVIQYKAPAIVTSSKPQSFSESSIGLSNSQIKSTPASSFSQINQSTAKVSTSQTGQYQADQYQDSKPTPQGSNGSYQQNYQSSTGHGLLSESGQYKGQSISASTSGQGISGSSSLSAFDFKQPSVVIAAKPKSNVGSSQTFSQSFSNNGLFSGFSSTNKKPSVQIIGVQSNPSNSQYKTQSAYSKASNVFIKPTQQSVSRSFISSTTTSRPASVAFQPQSSFSGFNSAQKSAFTTLKPAVFTTQYIKPQSSSNGFRSSSPTSVQFNQNPRKPANYQTGQYQAVQFSKAPTRISSGSSFTQSGQYQAYKPQSNLNSFQSIRQSTRKQPKPQVPKAPLVSQYSPQTSTVRPIVIATSKPFVTSVPSQFPTLSKVQQTYQSLPISSRVTQRPAFVTSKPRTSLNGFSSTPQSLIKFNQQPIKVNIPQTGQYQAVQNNKPLKSFSSGSSFAQASQYQSTKPQSSFGSFQGFSQPTSKARNYATSLGQTSGVSGFNYLTPIKSSVFTQAKPIPKPQVPKLPVVFQYAQKVATVRPTVIAASKPFHSYQSAQSPTFTKVQQSYQGFVSSSTTPRPAFATVKQQASFSGFKSTAQSSIKFNQQSSVPTLRPAVFTTSKPFVLYQPPKSLSFTKAQQSYQGIYSLPTKPVFGTTNSQTTFGGFQQFQKTVSPFGQQLAKPTVLTSTVQYNTKAPTTFRPQVFNVAAVAPQIQKSSEQYQLSSSSSESSGFLGAPTPATNQQLGSSNILKVSSKTAQSKVSDLTTSPPTLNPIPQIPTTSRSSISTSNPTTSFSQIGQQFGNPTVSSEQNAAFSDFENYGQSSVQKPVSVSQFTTSTTARPAVTFTPTVATTYQRTGKPSTNLEYLPPIGAIVPNKAPGSSGFLQVPFNPNNEPVFTNLFPSSQRSNTFGQATSFGSAFGSSSPSKSFFEFPSATVNQVVDVAQDHKVGGFAGSASLKSEVSVLANQIPSHAQEQKVEEKDLIANQKSSKSNDITFLSYQGKHIKSQEFDGVQPNFLHSLPSQQAVTSELTVKDETSVERNPYPSLGKKHSLNVVNSQIGKDLHVEDPLINPLINQEEKIFSQLKDQSKKDKNLNS